MKFHLKRFLEKIIPAIGELITLVVVSLIASISFA